MIPWWAGFLLFVSGILVGGMICWLLDAEDDKPKHKYLRKG